MNQKSPKSTIDHNIQVNIINGIAASIAINLVNPYFAKFIERMGASDYHIALLNSLPALISVFAFLPGAFLIESSRDKVKTTSYILLIQKFFYLLMALVPLINGPSKPLLFVILVGLMNFPGSIAGIGYQSCVGDVFPPNKRSIAMALRNKFSDASRLIITLIAGQLLSLIPKTNAQTLMLYQLFFIIAFILGLTEVFTILGLKRELNETQKTNVSNYFKAFKTTFLNLPKHKPFVTFLACSLTFHFGWQMGWPLMNIVTIKTLHASEAWLSAIAIAGGASSIFTSTLWAKFSNKKGNNFMLAVATFGMAITPLSYAFATTLFQILLFNIIMGVAIAGTVLILFNMLLEVTPNENRTIYIAIYSIFINISAAIAPIISIWLKDLTSIPTALILVSSFRFIGSIAFFVRNAYINSKPYS